MTMAEPHSNAHGGLGGTGDVTGTVSNGGPTACLHPAVTSSDRSDEWSILS